MKAQWIFDVTNYLGFTETIYVVAQTKSEAREILNDSYEYGIMECNCKGWVFPSWRVYE